MRSHIRGHSNFAQKGTTLNVSIDGVPSLLTVAIINGSALDLSWVIGSTNQDGHKIYYSTDNSEFTELATVLGSTSTYSATELSSSDYHYFKITAYKGALESNFSNTAFNKVPLPLLFDTNSVAFFDRTDPNGVRKDVSNYDEIYWDILTGKNLRGAEQNSGVIVKYAIYEITATQANFFYTGCAIGDVFICETVKTCDVNNKVKRVTGNHLTQPTATKKLYNGISDAVNDFMKTAPFTLAQPTSVYMYFRANTWINSCYIFEGHNADSGLINQNETTPGIKAYAGTYSGANTGLTIGSFHTLKVVFNGANSLFQVDDGTPTTGNFGAGAMGGFTLSSITPGTGQFTGIEVEAILIRKVVDSEGDATKLYNAINTNYHRDYTDLKLHFHFRRVSDLRFRQAAR